MKISLNQDGSITLHPRTLATIGLLMAGAVILWKVAAAQYAAQATDIDTSANWKPAPAPLMTRFASDVSPQKVRPEYPRPLLVRHDWQSLNGLWQFGFDDQNVGDKEGWKSGKPFAERILVPFTFESALSGIGQGNKVHERVWYRRSFRVPSGWNGKRVLLHFGAVDWETTVYVNGQEVGKHRGGYTPFTIDVTDALRSSGSQELVVRVYDPTNDSPDGWQPRGKQRGSSGIWYTRTTGIWQTVWLEPVPTTYIKGITQTPGVGPRNEGTLALSVTLPAGSDGSTVEVGVSHPGEPAVTQTAPVQNGQAAVTLTVPNAKLWSPESPELYDVSLKVTRDGNTVDAATSYTAFRSVGIAHGRLTLNGKPYFYRGVLDQGYWPDGIYTPPTDEAIKNDVEMTKKLGLNMARKHIKLEDPRWYYWCDHLGLAVWQDMPAATDLSKQEAKDNFRQEWTDIMGTARNYPCVVHWIPFNEDWGHPVAFQDEIVEMTRKLDPSRPITDASGWTQRGLTDVLDAHNYSDNLIKEGVPNPVKPKVIGEFGGVGLSIPGHVWAEGRIYVHTSRPEEMRDLVRRRTTQAFLAPNLSGFVYTQLTDVEQELNGLMTYDRQPKDDVTKLAAVMSGKDRAFYRAPVAIRDWLVLGPIPAGINVGSTQETPDSMDAMGRILDKPYLPNEASLQPKAGENVTVEGVTRSWTRVTDEQLDFVKLLTSGDQPNAVVYAVAEIDSPKVVSNATLLLGSDDGAVVWLNGQKVHRKVAIRGVEPYQDRIEKVNLRAGRNILVVKIGQGAGGWGLTAHLEQP